MTDHDPLCPSLEYSAPILCACDRLRAARADERERIAREDRSKEAAVVSAARAWVRRIVDPPSLWADEEDFVLIEAVNALGGRQR